MFYIHFWRQVAVPDRPPHQPAVAPPEGLLTSTSGLVWALAVLFSIRLSRINTERAAFILRPQVRRPLRIHQQFIRCSFCDPAWQRQQPMPQSSWAGRERGGPHQRPAAVQGAARVRAAGSSCQGRRGR